MLTDNTTLCSHLIHITGKLVKYSCGPDMFGPSFVIPAVVSYRSLVSSPQLCMPLTSMSSLMICPNFSNKEILPMTQKLKNQKRKTPILIPTDDRPAWTTLLLKSPRESQWALLIFQPLSALPAGNEAFPSYVEQCLSFLQHYGFPRGCGCGEQHNSRLFPTLSSILQTDHDKLLQSVVCTLFPCLSVFSVSSFLESVC